MEKNIFISIDPHSDSFIQSQVESGRYSSRNEVVCAALRLLEEEEEKLIVLRQALQEGIDSGWVEDFDPEKFIAEMKAGR